MEKNNNLMKGQGEDGEWITVNGAHVFVEKGQTVKDAINNTFNKKPQSKVQTTLTEEKRKRYDELGRKVTENRAKMKTASPEEQSRLMAENRKLMTEMDTMWDED